MKKRSIKGWAIFTYILSTLLSAFMIAAIIGTNIYSLLISNVLNAPTTKIINQAEDIYVSAYANYDALKAYQMVLGEDIASEGVVLLENNNQTLPFTSSVQKISLLGQNSVDPVYGGSGSGSVDSSKAIGLKTAFENAGYQINETLWDFYQSGAGSGYRKEEPSVTGSGHFEVNEVPNDVYTTSVTNSFSDYNDAAIVFIGRSGGESTDIPTSPLASGFRYLELDQNEQDLITMATTNFDTVILVLNTNNPIELSSVSHLPIDAILWVGGFGQTGTNGLAKVISGDVNPSGRLVDTFALNTLDAPSTANLGDYSFSNSSVDRGKEYMVYAEGIYIGHRYYETRYEDYVLNQGNPGSFNYADEVAYPFGYGLSYTSFNYTGYTVTENQTSFDVSVTITNSGSVAGKETVQVYMQSPYTDYDKSNLIEKAAVELVGFVKTDLLAPNQSQTVTISVDKALLKTYDATLAQTYILDAGDYYFTVAKDAHAAINNIIQKRNTGIVNPLVPSPLETTAGDDSMVYKHTVLSLDTTTYSTSLQTGYAITNQFTDVDITYYDNSFTYLSRNNWLGTWPQTYQNGTWEAPQDLIDGLAFNRSDAVVDSPAATMPKIETESETYGKLSVADLIGADYDDPRWQALIEQMSISNMTRLVRLGGYATVAIDNIGLPGTADKDGPSGFSSTLIPGRSGMAFPTQVLMASTWNESLLYEFGKAIGEDSLALGIHGWYAPGVNIHRSAYSGRNFEYYSEDGFLSGKMAAQVIKGAKELGVIAYMKHYALNDQETNRTGGAMFANEQSIREIYLKGFEIAAVEGNANALMVSMNRVGATWAGAHKGLMTEVLRNEWGFKGMAITDQASVPAMLYQDHISGLYAGTDLWLNTNGTLWSLSDYTNNPTVMTNVQEAAKHIVYAISQSNAMNGLSSSSTLVEIMPWWQVLLYSISGVVFVSSIGASTLVTIKWVKQKKQNNNS